jgi:predicted RNase H-like nuclease (RuvC/YqgF family)
MSSENNNNIITPLESCLKRSNFTGWSSEKIIERYESVLASREKQITDLSIEMGYLNEKITSLSDENKDLAEELKKVQTRLDKRVRFKR